MLEVTAIILLHDLLSQLLSLEVDEAVGRIASGHWVYRDIDGLHTSKNVLKQFLNILGRCLIWHIPDIQTTAFINGLLCLQIASALDRHIVQDAHLSVIDWLPETIT